MNTSEDQQQVQTDETTFELFNNDTPFGSTAAFFDLGDEDESIFTADPPGGEGKGEQSSLNNETKKETVLETPSTEDGAAGNQSPGGEQASSKPSSESGSNAYVSILQSLYGENLTVEVELEDGNTQDVPISEVDLSEEDFKEIVQQQQDNIKKETSKEFIPRKGLSDLMINLIEIDRNGGDIKPLLEIKTQHMDSIENYDLTTIQGQRQMIAHERSLRGDKQNDIQILLERYEKDGILQQEAEQVKESVQERYSKIVEDTRKKAEQDRAARDEQTKKYKKSLREEVELYDLPKQDKEKIVKISTEVIQGTDGSPKYGLDLLYANFRNNPALNAKLALFLSNPDTYDKIVSSKKVEEITMSRFKLKSKRPLSGSADFNRPPTEETLLTIGD